MRNWAIIFILFLAARGLALANNLVDVSVSVSAASSLGQNLYSYIVTPGGPDNLIAFSVIAPDGTITAGTSASPNGWDVFESINEVDWLALDPAFADCPRICS